jgi:hypothetical protein
MAGLENEMAADSGRARLRASDADREHMVDTLKAAYVYGLVTKNEFDARVSQTFASRTHAELALVTADLPAGLAAAHQRPRPTAAPGHAPAHANVGPGDRAIIATAIFAVLALVISISAGPFASPAAVLLVFGGAGECLRVLVPTRNQDARRAARQALRRSPASAASNSQRSGSWPPGGICSPGRTAPEPRQASAVQQR